MLYVSTSNRISKHIAQEATRKYSDLSNHNVKSILNSTSEFPVLIQSNETRDNEFINQFDVPVEYANGSFQYGDKILVVNQFEKTLYFV